MNLAQELGIIDPRTLFDLDFEIVALWLSYARHVQPIGEQAKDLRAAISDYLQTMMNTEKGKRSQHKFDNFVLSVRIQQAPAEQTIIAV